MRVPGVEVEVKNRSKFDQKANMRARRVLGRLWGRLGGVLGRLGGVLGRLGRVLQASWAVSGASWSVLGASWGPLGASCAHVRFLGRFFNAFSLIFHWKIYSQNHKKGAPAAATVPFYHISVILR